VPPRCFEGAAKLEAEVERCRAKDAEYQPFREQCHWLCAFAERKMRDSGKWEDEMKVGFAFLSLFGQHICGLVRHFLARQSSTGPAGGG
jgi:hypothetical protein